MSSFINSFRFSGLIDPNYPYTDDPYKAYVILHLTFDGTNGATVFQDSSSYANTVNGYSGAALSNSVVKYGTTALALDGVNDYGLVENNLSLFALGAGDFTIETWLRTPLSSWSTRIVTNRWPQNAMLGTWSFGVGNSYFQFTEVDVSAPGVTFYHNFLANTWYHIAISRISGIAYGFVNGNLISSGALPKDYFRNDRVVYIGTSLNESYFNGFLQDIRLTKGIGRYSASFSPPSQLLYSGT